VALALATRLCDDESASADGLAKNRARMARFFWFSSIKDAISPFISPTWRDLSPN
jgi:hypothetical protein